MSPWADRFDSDCPRLPGAQRLRVTPTRSRTVGPGGCAAQSGQGRRGRPRRPAVTCLGRRTVAGGPRLTRTPADRGLGTVTAARRCRCRWAGARFQSHDHDHDHRRPAGRRDSLSGSGRPGHLRMRRLIRVMIMIMRRPNHPWHQSQETRHSDTGTAAVTHRLGGWHCRARGT